MQLTMIFSALAMLIGSADGAGAQPAGDSIQLASPSGSLPRVIHNAFAPGEKLNFEISYGWLDAGQASIEIDKKKHRIHDREVWHIVGKGWSTGTFNWFFKVRDQYETYLDAEGVFPWRFVRDVDEGGYKIQQDYVFDHFNKKVKTEKQKEFDVPLGVQDMISAFYSARTLDFSKAKKGDVFTIQAFVDGELWPLQIKYLRKEQKEIDLGTFDCLVFAPVVQKGRIFKKEEDLQVWITNDRNRIPVIAEAKILVGSIKMELTSYAGMANRVAKID